MRRLTFAGLFSLIAFAATTDCDAADEQRSNVQAAIGKAMIVIERGARAYPSNQTCFACHHQTLPMLAMTSVRDSGLRFDKDLFGELDQFTRKSFAQRQKRLSQGEHIGGRAATVSYGLWTLALADDRPDEVSTAMAAYLISTQDVDGSWKPPSNRPPLEVSSVSCTVLSAIGVKRFSSADQQEAATQALMKARAWLAQAQLPEQEDLNFALWGQLLLGGTNESRIDLRDRILTSRQADGGWSQNPSLSSDAYATGQTLFILSECGLSPTDAAFREGIALLLETQQDDGSWHVVSRSKPIQPWFDNGDPHGKDQFISIAATSWATAALAKSLRQ